MDATYRADLREINELNFARFDAKVEQRLSELDAKWVGRWSALDAKLEQRLSELDAKWVGRWSTLDAKLEQGMAQLRTEIAQAQSATVKWMFAFWAPTAVGIAGTAAGVVALLLRR